MPLWQSIDTHGVLISLRVLQNQLLRLQSIIILGAVVKKWCVLLLLIISLKSKLKTRTSPYISRLEDTSFMTSPVLTLSLSSSLLTRVKPEDIPYAQLRQPPLDHTAFRLTLSEQDFLRKTISDDDDEVRRRVEGVQRR